MTIKKTICTLRVGSSAGAPSPC